MINMLIVDDEAIMRMGLSHIPWKKAGVHLVGIASSGTEALTIIQENAVHILFTDIQMPDINGLELIRAATQINPAIRSILLTGHSDFNYAKEAISLQVYDYILKPCDPSEVLKTIGKLAAEIESGQRAALEHNIQQSQLSLHHAESVLLRLFSSQKITPDEMQLLEKPPLCFRADDQFTIAIIKHANKETIITEILNFPFGYAPYVLADNNGLTMILFHRTKTGDSSIKEIQDFLMQLCETLHQNGTNLKIGLGITVYSSSELLTAYQTARICSDLFFSHPSCDFLKYEEISGLLNTYHPDEIRQKLITGVQQKNYVEIRLLLEELRKFYELYWIPVPQIRLDMIDLCLTVSNITAQKDSRLSSGLSAEQLLSINGAESLDELIQAVLTLITGCIDYLTQASGNKIQHYLTECLDFMNQNYTEDINLIIAADTLHMNSDYLGRMLKKEFGQPFNQILTGIRLEKACTLLANVNITISEVASQTGFKDFRTFGQLFKNHYHQTPSEYRKSICRKGIEP